MIRLISLSLVGWTLCVAPVAADEDIYDGPTAIKPLTVTPQPQHSAPPNTVCDFEHQCYPEKGGLEAPAPVAPPAMQAGADAAGNWAKSALVVVRTGDSSPHSRGPCSLERHSTSVPARKTG